MSANPAGVILIGIDPASELMVGAVGSSVAEGAPLSGPGRPRRGHRGAKLAARLETEIGKRVVLMSQDPDNEVADRGFRVIGLFDANLAAQEEMFAFAGRETVQAMLGIGNSVSEIAVVGDDYREVGQFARQGAFRHRRGRTKSCPGTSSTNISGPCWMSWTASYSSGSW